MVKLFDKSFKLYAYKKYDICDLSFRVNDNFVLTYRLTHDQLKQMLEGAYEKPGVNVAISGGKIYAVVKKSIDAVRVSITAHNATYNLRYSIEDWEVLNDAYKYQMYSPVDWDDYDPR